MLKLSSLAKKYIDFEFYPQNYRVRVIERPGLWMEPEKLSEIIDQMRAVVGTLGKGDLEYGVLSGKPERTSRAILTLIYDKQTGKCVAFNALSAMDCSLHGQEVDVIHLGLVAVDPSFRAKGMSWILYGFTTFLIFMRRRLKPVWISNVTQVPAIIGMVSDSFGNVFPAPLPQSRRSFDHLSLARQILARHRVVFGVGEDATFNEEKFVIEDSYTGGSDNLKKTFSEAAPHRNPLYNEFCRTGLDYDRGDDYLQLGQVTLSSFFQFVAKSIPRDSLVATSWFLLNTLLEALILPVIYWFSVNDPMEDLRPWR